MAYPDTQPSLTPSTHGEVAADVAGLAATLNTALDDIELRPTATQVDAAIAAAIASQPKPPVVFSSETPILGTTGTDRAATARTIVQARMRVGTAPVGSAMTVVVQHYNGTAWSDVVTLSIPAGQTTEAVSTALTQAQAAGHLARLNVTSIGSTTPASDVVVELVLGAAA